MEIRTEKRVIEIEDKIYIAEDGKEFGTRADCERYEDKLQEQKDFHLSVLVNQMKCISGMTQLIPQIHVLSNSQKN